MHLNLSESPAIKYTLTRCRWYDLFDLLNQVMLHLLNVVVPFFFINEWPRGVFGSGSSTGAETLNRDRLLQKRTTWPASLASFPLLLLHRFCASNHMESNDTEHKPLLHGARRMLKCGPVCGLRRLSVKRGCYNPIMCRCSFIPLSARDCPWVGNARTDGSCRFPPFILFYYLL